ncbi:MAG: hypothetical protein NT175_05640 [Bacteroidetes bacterium]|nr:hypothetical protein [Bacteroidota bacterium]
MELSPYLQKNWSKIEIDHLKFILEQAEKTLNATVETANGHSKKSAWIFGLFLSILIVVLGSWITGEVSGEYMISGIPFICNVILILYFSFRAQKMYSINIPGTRAEGLLTDEFFEPFEDPALAYKNMILSKCIDYDESIVENRIINNRRLQRLEKASKMILIIPCSVLLSFLLYLLLY